MQTIIIIVLLIVVAWLLSIELRHQTLKQLIEDARRTANKAMSKVHDKLNL